MKLNPWPFALLGAASLFGAGYVAGQTIASPIPELGKQPATMLSVGASMAAQAYGRTIGVRGDKLVVEKVTYLRMGPGATSAPTPAECPALLETERRTLGVQAYKDAPRSRSSFSLHFLPIQDRASQAPSVLARRDAIDAATIVRLTYVPIAGAPTGCEGILGATDARPF